MSDIIFRILAHLILKCMISKVIRNIKTYFLDDYDIVLTVEVHIRNITLTFRIKL